MTTTPTARTTPTAGTTPATAHGHGPRLPWAKLAPEVYKAMIALDAAAKQGLDPALVDLVKIRASQLNHCAFCIDMHIKDARETGETEQRIYLLNAWEEAAGHYTDKEQAALALTEAITLLTEGFVPDAVYDRAAAHFGDTELAHLVALITTINAWNRFGVSTRMAPGPA
ncbi:carboxymuconolactone decarboxylase family protein [Streptomyces libani]|uniref:Carboxymuconolactone decarboxylase family protein n=3 Tax=Streptomyces nigrescens TaxID=1920 RepID=A0ABY7IEB8_STRNI|nr:MULTISPECIES: carboxymuconolactone decarboxylase family protein [Streptomyces]MCX5448733.1 carboxymuconolactone decarboxylase family protein [Streptomyces libani]WAT97103.1 carboxymuconolactone decarboxylase family protein [Streptomyces libani subsp. libani]WAU05041.1 carboxymuconolactone decarboxylase family protein [Streptomyces nigrescens]WDT57150.1 carboxymuconolactone decarboxylase family protein [Streptomyces sp. G7(2002)]